MGAELAGIASARYAHLPAAPYKVLMRMCLMALDKANRNGEPDRLYFGGWEPLALAMGRDIPTGPHARARRDQLASDVARACRQLRKHGAIEPITDRAGTGNRQVYRLTLHPVDNPIGDKP